MIVVDASVVVKTVFPEQDSEAVLDFFVQHRDTMCAPDILLSEVASAIVRRTNMRDNTPEEGLEKLAVWRATWSDRLFIPYRLTPVRIETAGRLAIQLGHPIADCLYLALANELGCDLLTCDAKFIEKAVRLHPNVKPLRQMTDR